MGERPQINWVAIAAMPVDGDDIPIGPRRNVLGTTSLTSPILVGDGCLMTNTSEAEAPEPVDLRQIIDEMEAFRAAEAAERQRYVEAAMKMLVDLSGRGQDEQAFAILRSLTQPEPFYATRFDPSRS